MLIIFFCCFHSKPLTVITLSLLACCETMEHSRVSLKEQIEDKCKDASLSVCSGSFAYILLIPLGVTVLVPYLAEDIISEVWDVKRCHEALPDLCNCRLVWRISLKMFLPHQTDTADPQMHRQTCGDEQGHTGPTRRGLLFNSSSPVSFRSINSIICSSASRFPRCHD